MAEHQVVEIGAEEVVIGADEQTDNAAETTEEGSVTIVELQPPDEGPEEQKGSGGFEEIDSD